MSCHAKGATFARRMCSFRCVQHFVFVISLDRQYQVEKNVEFSFLVFLCLLCHAPRATAVQDVQLFFVFSILFYLNFNKIMLMYLNL